MILFAFFSLCLIALPIFDGVQKQRKNFIRIEKPTPTVCFGKVIHIDTHELNSIVSAIAIAMDTDLGQSQNSFKAWLQMSHSSTNVLQIKYCSASLDDTRWTASFRRAPVDDSPPEAIDFYHFNFLNFLCSNDKQDPFWRSIGCLPEQMRINVSDIVEKMTVLEHSECNRGTGFFV
ncbi:MAG: hypothetical protein V7695_19625 [Sulfitobacter sp.]